MRLCGNLKFSCNFATKYGVPETQKNPKGIGKTK
jgi:hypothetical protein